MDKSYLKLAAAIVQSGINCNDESFLESNWCAYLVSTISDFTQHSDKAHINYKDDYSNGYKFLK